MGSKVIFNIFFISLLINLVKGHFEFETPTQALDNTLFEEVLDEKLCDEQINVIRENPLLMLYFADAGIRVPKGILQGNTLDMGNYHQCININQPLPDSDLQGKYCVIDVPTDQNLQLPGLPDLSDNSMNNILEEYKIMRKGMKAYTGIIDNDRMLPDNPLSGLQLRLAVCIPKPCTTKQALNSLLPNISMITFEYSDVYCRLRNDRPWAPADYTAIAVFSLLGLITLVSTSYDLWHTFFKKTDPKAVHVIGKSFSVYTNGHRLMTFTSGPDTVECIDGIRALAMAWVLVGHTFTSETSISNLFDAFTWSQSWQALWILAAHFTVDTFFTLSGFLVVYTTVGNLTSESLVKNLHLFYLNRLLRMFPLLAAAVLLEASYLNRMTDGPNWTTISNQVNRCRSSWWSTLLHVQNYMNPTTTCIGQSWYLAIDVQLHILSPIILVWVLWGKRKIAWTALGAGYFSVLTASTIFIFLKNFPPIMVAAGREHEMFDYLVNYYVNTLTRAPPFIVGMIFGYLVRVSKTKLTGMNAMFFWTLFFGLTTCLIYTNYPVNQVTWDNEVVSNMFNSFVRSFWAISVGSLIYACMNGFADPINWFLCLNVWKIHSRLSYAMYLFHYMLMVAINYTAVTPVHFTVGLTVFKFLAHYVFSMIVSFLMTLLIDLPFSTLFKLILGGHKTKHKDSE